jgi:glycosyltransferase involved in cell wall biosynthesis
MEAKALAINGGISISFCVTCRNRLWQLQETLESNLSVLGKNHEIVLVDFGSSDGLSSWVWAGFEDDIRNGRLTFFEVLSEVSWSSPKAKNLAHRLAKGNYLFNLDADNFLTGQDLAGIEDAAATGVPCQQWSGT